MHGTDPGRGTVTTNALPGPTLQALLAGPRAQAACAATGAALAALHRLEPPPAVPVHDWSAEQADTQRWQQYAINYRAPLTPPGAADEASARVEIDYPLRTLIHRDFHDLQVLVDEDGRWGSSIST